MWVLNLLYVVFFSLITLVVLFYNVLESKFFIWGFEIKMWIIIFINYKSCNYFDYMF